MQAAKQAVRVDRGRAFHGPEAAPRIGVSPETLPAWRSRGKGPVYHKLGRRVVYFEADLDAYLEARAVDPEAV